MAKPKHASTAAATVAVRRKAQERKAAELRAIGAEVILPHSTQRSEKHVVAVEIKGGDGSWRADRDGRQGPQLWYTPDGAALLVQYLDERGFAARCTTAS
jgi:hypothetical protein